MARKTKRSGARGTGRTSSKAGAGGKVAKGRGTARATRTARTARPARSAATRAGAVPPVRVRMYRQGLGDCFLLTFGAGGAARHVLIDCGTLGSTEFKVGGKKDKVSMEEVVEDVIKATGGRISLVIATHEHTDHVSGFHGELKRFKDKQGKLRVTVDNVWMAWTENPGDADAKKHRKYTRDLGMALVAALGATEKDSELRTHLSDLLGFSGFPPDGVPSASAAGVGLDDEFRATIDASMHAVRKGFGREAEYRQPKEVLEPDWLPGFRVYVLGPPRDMESLRVEGDHGSGELYNLRMAAMAGVSADLQNAVNDDVPFDTRFRVACPRKDAEQRACRRWYPDYFEEDAEWRRIDQAWLAPAHQLALQLDNLTNNTSLALAFERIDDGKVLLFPADAQLGNWESWHKVEFKVGGGTVTVPELLGRTVFYKVGHHGSHNATAKGQGLELMGDDLTAFIPVDRRIALNKGGEWKMPARPLYKRLLEKCDGRVARSDLGLVDDAANAADKTTEDGLRGVGTAAQWTGWRKAQKKAPVIDDSNRLFVEYRLE